MKKFQSLEPRPIEANNLKVSQSMIKAFQDYEKGKSCGVLFREEYINRSIRWETSEEQLLGQFFEYTATGARNYYNEIPEPERYTTTRAGMYNAGDVKGKFVNAEADGLKFREYCEQMGWKVIQAGVKFERDNASFSFDAIIQIPQDSWEIYMGGYFKKPGQFTQIVSPKWEDCKWTHTETGEVFSGCVVVDLKYSGELYTKWSDFSWGIEWNEIEGEWSFDRLAHNEHHKIQARHYAWGSRLPFFFWVWANDGTGDNRLIRCLFSKQSLEAYKPQTLDYYHDRIGAEIVDGFKTIPSMAECPACPFKDNCIARAKAPVPELVDFN